MNGEKPKSKIEGWRKMGIGIFAIGSLATFKDTMSFDIAVIIGVITIVAILTQGYLDNGTRPPKTN